MLASRAWRKVQEAPLSSADRQEQRELVDAFVAAGPRGFGRLLEVLDPGITRTTHYPHGRVVQLGKTEAHAAADCSERGLRAAVTVRRVLVNGEPCVLAWLRTRIPLGLMACTARDGRIIDAVSVVGPVRLGRRTGLLLPRPADAARPLQHRRLLDVRLRS